jgi:BASS family bile acid:Na+ symporter
MLKRFTSLYPLWIVSSSLLGLLKPEALTGFAGPRVVCALSLVMLGMGFMLTLAVMVTLTSRTIAIEVGMQNGGMAAVLAKKNCPLEPMAAVPAVFSSVVQTLVGSLVADYWRARPPAESSPTPEPASAPVAPIAKESRA